MKPRLKKERGPEERPSLSAARSLDEAEKLYRDFLELTPLKFVPLAKSFDSFEAYERWKRDEAPPWYR